MKTGDDCLDIKRNIFGTDEGYVISKAWTFFFERIPTHDMNHLRICHKNPLSVEEKIS